MTPHDIARELNQLSKRMDGIVDAITTLRQLTELNSQRIDNIQDTLFNLFPKKE